jgi:hypothetical protein
MGHFDDLAQSAIRHLIDDKDVALREVFDEFEATTDRVNLDNIQSVYSLLRIWAHASSCKVDFCKSIAELPIKMSALILGPGGWGHWSVLKCWCRVQLNWSPMLTVFEKILKNDSKLALIVSADVIIPYALSNQPHGIVDVIRQPRFLKGFKRIHRQFNENVFEPPRDVEDTVLRDAVASLCSRFEVQCRCLLWGALTEGQVDMAASVVDQLAGEAPGLREGFEAFVSTGTVPEAADRKGLLIAFDDVGLFVCSNAVRPLLCDLKCTWIP